jgi:hypothetical protein
MENIVRAYCSAWLPDKETSYQKYFIDVYTYGRMDQMADCVTVLLSSSVGPLFRNHFLNWVADGLFLRSLILKRFN